jgi:fucose 4-O-acetylase-like acetyltransferase
MEETTMADDRYLVSQDSERLTSSDPGGSARRIPSLDNLRALAIFLVILAHLIAGSPLEQYIKSFDIPLFFFVSGHFFDRQKYDFGQFFRKKIRSLVVPYLFFATVSFLFWFFVVRKVSISGRALAIDPLKPLLGILYGIGSGDMKVPMSGALWFLPCLFVVEIVFYSVRNKLLLVVFAILGYMATFLPFRLPWSADVALVGIVFYGLGYFYKDIRISLRALPFLFALSLVFCFLNDSVHPSGLVYGNVLYFYISAVSGILFYSALCQFTKRNRVLEYVGSNTIVLIGLADITRFILRGIWYILFRTVPDQSGIGLALAASVLQMCLTIPAIYCINNWLPFLLGRPSRRTLRNMNK